jgi:hypothetical protein
VEQGAYSLMQAVGLEKLKTNMVLVGDKHDWAIPTKEELSKYFTFVK